MCIRSDSSTKKRAVVLYVSELRLLPRNHPLSGVLDYVINEITIK